MCCEWGCDCAVGLWCWWVRGYDDSAFCGFCGFACFLDFGGVGCVCWGRIPLGLLGLLATWCFCGLIFNCCCCDLWIGGGAVVGLLALVFVCLVLLCLLFVAGGSFLGFWVSWVAGCYGFELLDGCG